MRIDVGADHATKIRNNLPPLFGCIYYSRRGSGLGHPHETAHICKALRRFLCQKIPLEQVITILGELEKKPNRPMKYIVRTTEGYRERPL
jgi:hypothetical protein